jgi:hypothetical protein
VTTLDGRWRLGISASLSPDLGRLGLVETHYRVALGEITRSVLLAGGGVIYGGRVNPDGYTTFMLREVQRYARRDRPLLVCLAWTVHRAMSPAELAAFRRELGLFGHLVLLDLDGAPLPLTEADAAGPAGPAGPADGVEASASAEDSPDISDVDTRARSLLGLRRYMTDHQVGRVFLGGRREGFEGRISGLVEEVLLTLERGQPIYLAGGYGGVTYDVARLLGLPDGDWPIGREPVPDPRYAAGLAAVREFADSGRYAGLNNGLAENENRLLMLSHRPSEIASLVSRGLRRVLGDQYAAPVRRL